VSNQTIAERLRRGDAAAAAEIARQLIVPFNNNLVARPWGGSRLLAYKGLDRLPESIAGAGLPAGEAFEIAAFDADVEAERYPSIIECADGSLLELPDLLGANGNTVLGDAFVARYGACIPLLPKTLDVGELLSVQGHPPGNTEAYIVIDADPDATIRLGFSADIDERAFAQELTAGRREQAEFVDLLIGRSASLERTQRVLAPWLAARGAPPDDIAQAIKGQLESETDWPAARVLLERMKRLYWRVLDSLNAVPVEAGQVIYNATPTRLLAGSDEPPSAEVHALGNPERRGVLALEIRRPGPTFRAWDNVRFPLRDVDVDAALAALNLSATRVEDFVVYPELVPGRAGVYCSVDSEAFRIEHLRPSDSVDDAILIAEESPHCLHAIHGISEFFDSDGNSIGALRQGQSALVPFGVRAYKVAGRGVGAELIKVNVPI